MLAITSFTFFNTSSYSNKCRIKVPASRIRQPNAGTILGTGCWHFWYWHPSVSLYRRQSNPKQTAAGVGEIWAR